jgi:hypothetical protein
MNRVFCAPTSCAAEGILGCDVGALVLNTPGLSLWRPYMCCSLTAPPASCVYGNLVLMGTQHTHLVLLVLCWLISFNPIRKHFGFPEYVTYAGEVFVCWMGEMQTEVVLC